MKSLDVIPYEDKEIIQGILDEASKIGETMLQGNPDLDWFFDNGFFLADSDHRGFFWCRVLDASTMEVHTTFLPGFRGHFARRAARDGMRKVFTELNIDRLVTKCRTEDGKVILFSQWLGFQSLGYIGESLLMECTLDRAILKDSELANIAYEANFPVSPDSSEDQTRFLGFAILCMFQDRTMRGIEIYNRMAVLMDWEPLILLNDKPILIGIGSRQFSPMSETEA